MNLERKRAFIINFTFFTIIVVLFYIILKYVLAYVMPFVIAAVIGMLINPLSRKLAEKTKISRRVWALIVFLLLIIITTGLIIILGIVLIGEATNFFKNLPAYFNDIQPTIESIQTYLYNIFSSFPPEIKNYLDSIVQSLNTHLFSLINSISSYAVKYLADFVTKLPNVLLFILITIIATFFINNDYNKIAGFLTRQLPEKYQNILLDAKNFIFHTIFKLLRAYALIVLLTFTELAILLSIGGIKYAIVIAAIIALIDILPVIGSGLILIPWSVSNFITGNFKTGLYILIVYVVITIIRNIVEPKIISKNIGLYPLVTLICMFVGLKLFGIVGMLGMPIIVLLLRDMQKKNNITFWKE